MIRIQLGGIKILEGQSYIEWSCDEAEDALASICRRLAAEQINLSQVTYIADDGRGRSSTALCTESANSFTNYFLIKLDAGREPQLRRDTTILSVFPHDRRPLITGALLELAARGDMHLLAIASSSSAMSVVVPSEDTKGAIDGIFSVFEFPTYRSPLEWQAAYVGKEQIFKDVVGSYEEQTPKVYAVLDQPDLDLWILSLNRMEMKQMGAALEEIDGLGMKMPFFVAHCDRPHEMVLSLCLPSSHRQEVSKALDAHAPHAVCSRHDAAGVFLHGPHFGDRYGIAGALTEGLQTVGIHPLALSCAVHSIWVVLQGQDLHRGLQAIKAKFHVPTENG
jgi:aspartokinase